MSLPIFPPVHQSPSLKLIPLAHRFIAFGGGSLAGIFSFPASPPPSPTFKFLLLKSPKLENGEGKGERKQDNFTLPVWLEASFFSADVYCWYGVGCVRGCVHAHASITTCKWTLGYPGKLMTAPLVKWAIHLILLSAMPPLALVF